MPGDDANDRSGPAFQPSGPVPKVESVASGSGPNDKRPAGAVAAAPPAAGADATGPMEIPTTQADSLRAWDRVLEELMRRRKVVLGGYCEHARVMSWTADEIVLGYSPDFHHFGELVRDSAEDVRIVLREVVRGNPKLSVRMLDGAAANEGNGRSVLEAGREKSTAERHKRELEAREHPITKHVLQTFGAQIKEIKTDV
ncbi:MAG: hypothetical protein H0T79_21720 [Deltaproteobacteria bacterium]|nr:hypothetical protein [Deltaproteobacteria bacterium]